jgi:hypothetical protein
MGGDGPAVQQSDRHTLDHDFQRFGQRSRFPRERGRIAQPAGQHVYTVTRPLRHTRQIQAHPLSTPGELGEELVKNKQYVHHTPDFSKVNSRSAH